MKSKYPTALFLSDIFFGFSFTKRIKHSIINVYTYLYIHYFRYSEIEVNNVGMGFSNGIKIKKPAYTKDTELYKIEHIPKVFIPVSDNYTVTVAEGDKVKVGQLLGIALGHQIPLHCSVSGTVVGCVNIEGDEYIEIDNDGKYELCSDIAPCEKRLSQMNEQEMIDRIRLCGIHDWTKLSNAKGQIKRFAVNCLDSDPYSSDKRCALYNFTKEIIGGAKIILKILGIHLCELVIDHRDPDSINLLIDCIGDSELFDIVDTKANYPLGEKQRLITHLPNSEELDDDELLILDVHSVAAVYRAFSQGMPYVRRTVSVGGSATCEDGCYDIPLGTPIKYISDQCVNQENDPNFKTVIGGVMKGELSEKKGELISSRTHTISFIKEKELNVRIGACIGCTECDRACPDKLLPSVFIANYEKDFDGAIRSSGMEFCSECGACSYVCPSNIPICEIAQEDTAILSPDRRYKKHKKEKAPFIHHPESVRSRNFDIILALGVLWAWAVCRFGISALILCGISVGVAILTELIYNLLTRSGAFGVFNMDSVVCGMLGALTLTADTPIYVPAITAFFSVMFLKGAFGGNGKNLLHSAFGARVLASLIFHDAFVYSAKNHTLFDYLLGNTEGSFGEISVILLCAVFIYLAFRRIISLITPAVLLSTYAIVTFLCAPAGNAVNTTQLALIGTAVIFVSVFCGVEYSTIPKSAIGKVAYGALAGAVAALIGRYTSYEGAYIAVLIASALTPLFNRLHEADTDDFVTEDDDQASLSPYFDINEEDEDENEYSDTSENVPITYDNNNEGNEAEYPQPEDGTAVFDSAERENETSDLSEKGNSTDEPLTDTEDDMSEEVIEEEPDFSQTMEFSDEKADELLALLSKEIGIIAPEQGTESETEAQSEDEALPKEKEIPTEKAKEGEKDEAPAPSPALDSTAMFDILYDEADTK